MSLQGKTILITGASAGIGRATAVQLAAQGAHIIALGRRQDALDALAASMPKGQVRTLAGDLNDESFVQKIDALAPELDAFVNNAGVLRYAPILDLTPEDNAWMFQTNVLAALRVTQGIARGMVHNKRGHIVFMSSIAAREVYRLASVYCATKHALSALARAFRIELQAHGIKVTEVAPGMVDTDMTNKHTGDGTRPAAWLAPVIAATVMLQPEDIAAGVIELIEDDSAVAQSKIVGNTGREYNT